MVVTIEMLMSVVTALVTYVFGWASKKFGWVESKYIPYQNAVIGLILGILCYLLKLTDADLITSIIYCLIGSMASGGTYDLTKVNKG